MLADRLHDAADDENVVDDGHAGEEAIEDAAHLLAQQDGDGYGVGHEAGAPEGDLRGALQPPAHRLVGLDLLRGGTVADGKGLGGAPDVVHGQVPLGGRHDDVLPLGQVCQRQQHLLRRRRRRRRRRRQRRQRHPPTRLEEKKIIQVPLFFCSTALFPPATLFLFLKASLPQAPFLPFLLMVGRLGFDVVVCVERVRRKKIQGFDLGVQPPPPPPPPLLLCNLFLSLSLSLSLRYFMHSATELILLSPPPPFFVWGMLSERKKWGGFFLNGQKDHNGERKIFSTKENASTRCTYSTCNVVLLHTECPTKKITTLFNFI